MFFMANKKEERIALFAGGCFWCMQPPLDNQEGVIKTTVGYTGGKTTNPTYEDVAKSTTGHYEAVEVTYDPTIINYKKLLDVFLDNINPEDEQGQFADKGPQYRTAVFYTNEKQRRTAEKTIKERSKKEKITTKVLQAKEFYKAEKEHQNYYKKKPLRYKLYKHASGRTSYLKQKKEEKELQRKVTKEQGTEQPFKNKYWNNHEEGIYVDVDSARPLFSSADKYDSGSGWPSFTKPITPEAVSEQVDESNGMRRIEVKSKDGNHLGHVFDDGPRNQGGKRYCINSASLRFIPMISPQQK